jgi:hypothetical protein
MEATSVPKSLCTLGNYNVWRKTILIDAFGYGEPGKALISNTKKIFLVPQSDDDLLDPDTGDLLLDGGGNPIRAYDNDTEDGSMSSAGAKSYREDVYRYSVMKRIFVDHDARLLAHILQNIFIESKTIISAHPGYHVAYAAGDSFKIF